MKDTFELDNRITGKILKIGTRNPHISKIKLPPI